MHYMIAKSQEQLVVALEACQHQPVTLTGPVLVTPARTYQSHQAPDQFQGVGIPIAKGFEGNDHRVIA